MGPKLLGHCPNGMVDIVRAIKKFHERLNRTPTDGQVKDKALMDMTYLNVFVGAAAR